MLPATTLLLESLVSHACVAVFAAEAKVRVMPVMV